MSVLCHLTDNARKLVFYANGNSDISLSISTLDERLKAYFGTEIRETFRFGSSTRDTMLPRAVDEEADIDYMVIFKDEDELNHQSYFPMNLL
jgi:hypothetical protein